MTLKKATFSLRFFDRLVDIVGSLGFGIIVLACFSQVVNRYIFHESFKWAEEMSIYVMVLITFLGAAKGVRVNAHTRITVLIDKLPTPIKEYFLVFGDLLCVFFCAVVFYYGSIVTVNNISRTSVGFKISMGYIYGILPVCSAIMILFLLIRVFDVLRSINVRPSEMKKEEAI